MDPPGNQTGCRHEEDRSHRQSPKKASARGVGKVALRACSGDPVWQYSGQRRLVPHRLDAGAKGAWHRTPSPWDEIGRNGHAEVACRGTHGLFKERPFLVIRSQARRSANPTRSEGLLPVTKNCATYKPSVTICVQMSCYMLVPKMNSLRRNRKESSGGAMSMTLEETKQAE